MGSHSMDSIVPFLTYGGTARATHNGPAIGLVDIGDSDDAYLFQVSLPGIRRNECNVTVNIEEDGTVCISGEIIPEVGRGSRGVFLSRVDQLPSSGPFTISFKLPGPVDPLLFTPEFRADGILEGVVMKTSYF